PARHTRSSAAHAAPMPNRICTASPCCASVARHATPKGARGAMYFASGPERSELLGFLCLDRAHVHVAIGAPRAAPPRARADIGLLDATAVDVDLGEDAAVAIVTVRDEPHVAALHQGLELLLGSAAARLVHLGGIDVGESHFLVVADQRVAVDRDAAFSPSAVCQ